MSIMSASGPELIPTLTLNVLSQTHLELLDLLLLAVPVVLDLLEPRRIVERQSLGEQQSSWCCAHASRCGG